jgi:hypothetical protein
MIKLDDLNTDNGCVQHLLLAETLGPASNKYDFDDLKIVVRAMKSVILNRKKLKKNNIFCSKNASTIRDYICAPVSNEGCQSKQFEGFELTSGEIVITKKISDRINEMLTIANSSSDSRKQKYSEHIKEIIAVSKETETKDPYSDIPLTIDDVSVLSGVYGWRTSGEGTGGGNYVKIPKKKVPYVHPDGDLQGIQFLTIKTNSLKLNEEQVDSNNLAIDPDTYASDMLLLDKYQSFSSQLLKISISGLSVLGLFLSYFYNKEEVFLLSKETTYSFFISAIIFVISIFFSLSHLYVSSDSMALHIEYLRKKQPKLKDRRNFLLTLSGKLLLGAAISLFIAAAVVVIGIAFFLPK